MDEAERERRTQAWHELIERLWRAEVEANGYRQDPRTASKGSKNRRAPIVTYVSRRMRIPRGY